MSDDQNTSKTETPESGRQPAPSSGPSENISESQQGCHCEDAAKAADQAQASSGQHVYPQVTFTTFVLSLSSSAMVHLGDVPEPETGAVQQNLPLAKHTIDILAMLKDKTSKCLDAEEARLLDGVLYELRMIYVMKSK